MPLEQVEPFSSIQTTGTVTRVEGTVFLISPDGGRIPLAIGDIVFPGDRVESDAGSVIAIVLNDGSLVMLDENSRLVFNGVVFDQGFFEVSLKVLSGAFMIVGGQTDTGVPSKMMAETEVATVDTTGATLVVSLANAGSAVFTLLPNTDGSLGVVEVTTAGGAVVLTRSFHTATVIDGDAAPNEISSMSADEVVILHTDALAILGNDWLNTGAGQSGDGDNRFAVLDSAELGNGLSTVSLLGGSAADPGFFEALGLTGGGDDVLKSSDFDGSDDKFGGSDLDGDESENNDLIEDDSNDDLAGDDSNTTDMTDDSGDDSNTTDMTDDSGGGTENGGGGGEGGSDRVVRVFPSEDALASTAVLPPGPPTMIYFGDLRSQYSVNESGVRNQMRTLMVNEETQESKEGTIEFLAIPPNIGTDTILGGDPGKLDIVDYTNGDAFDGAFHINLEADTVQSGDGTIIVLQGIQGAFGGAGADTILGADDSTPGSVDLNGINFTYDIGDVLFGGAGDDLLGGSAGNDILHGEQGSDILAGDTGEDFLFGGPGDDILYGGAGDDYLDSGSGNDTLHGGSGNDSYVIDKLGLGAGRDTILDIAGDGDRLGFWSNPFPAGSSDQRLTTTFSLVLVRGPQVFNLPVDYDFYFDDTILNIDWLGNPAIGVDILEARTDDNSEYGIEAFHFQTLPQESGGENIAMGLIDTGDDGNNIIVGSGESETILAADGRDAVYGSGGDDSIDGGDGRDFLIGGAGADTLVGGAGDDYVNGGDGDDRLDGNDGLDWITVLYAPAGATINLATGLMTGGWGGEDTITGFENVRGSNHADLVIGDDEVNEVLGYDGNDTLCGGGNTDFLWGGAGDDLLEGGAGDDFLSGDGAGYLGGALGIDTLYGGDGNDYMYGEVLYGEAGNDRLFGDGDGGTGGYIDGGDGEDFLGGGMQDDTLFGGAGDDILRPSTDDGTERVTNDGLVDGGAGTDVLHMQGYVNLGTGIAEAENTTLTVISIERVIGASGYGETESTGWGSNSNDTFIGDSRSNTLEGANGDDELYGRGGDDVLLGGADDDVLRGGAGNDVLDGGAGNDFLRGGNGNDFYVYGRHVPRSDPETVPDPDINHLSATFSSLNETIYEAVYKSITSSWGGEPLDPTGAGIDIIKDTTGDFDAIGFRSFTALNEFGEMHQFYEISPADLTFSRVGNDLRVRDTGVAEESGFDIVDHYDGQAVEYILFQSITEEVSVEQMTETGETIQVIEIRPIAFAVGEMGTDSHDLIVGSSAADLIAGLLGDDMLFGNSGEDTLIANGGDDTLSGGTGTDHFEVTSEAVEAVITVLDLEAGETIDISGLLALDETAPDPDRSYDGNIGDSTIVIGTNGLETTLILENFNIFDDPTVIDETGTG